MKNNSTTKLAVVFVVLAGASFLFSRTVERRYETGETAKASQALFEDLAKEQVAKLSIAGPEDSEVALVREGDTWKVASEGGYRADQDQVDKALDALLGLKQGKVASRNPDLDEFELTGQQAIEVKAEDGSGEVLASVVLGKSANFRETFFQVGDQSEVRKSDTNVRRDFEKTGGWRDKTILEVGESEDVTKLTVDGPEQRLVFVREEEMGPKDDAEDASDSEEEAGEETTEEDESLEVKELVWRMLEPMDGLATKWRCDSMANALSDLRCDDFYAGDLSKADLGLEPPRYTVTAERKDGSQTVLYLGEAQDQQFPVMLPDQETIWMVSLFRGEYFTKAPRDYLQDPPPEEEPEAISEDGVDGDTGAVSDEEDPAEES